jgi:DNA-binding PadR family transcriptional regulator
MRISPTRMFVLGLLARHGALHGHALRRMAHQDRTELWTEVKVGSLYSTLRQLALEGMVAAERTEQVGKLPTRTIYAITDQGRRELQRLRHSALRDSHLRPDPADLALALADGVSDQDLTEVVRHRREALQAQMQSWSSLKEKAWPHLSGAERQVFGHYERRYQAELGWHDELLQAVPIIAAETQSGRTLGGLEPEGD